MNNMLRDWNTDPYITGDHPEETEKCSDCQEEFQTSEMIENGMQHYCFHCHFINQVIELAENLPFIKVHNTILKKRSERIIDLHEQDSDDLIPESIIYLHDVRIHAGASDNDLLINKIDEIMSFVKSEY